MWKRWEKEQRERSKLQDNIISVGGNEQNKQDITGEKFAENEFGYRLRIP